MKVNISVCFMLLIGSIIITSCKEDKKVLLPKKVLDRTEVENNLADSIIQKNVGLFNLYKTTNKTQTETFIFSSNRPSEYAQDLLADGMNFILLSKYRNDNKQSNLIKQDTLFSIEDYYVSVEQKNFEKKNINGKEFVFFSIEENPMGQFATETILDFFIIDITDMNYYNLKFTGKQTRRSRSTETLEGEYTKSNALNQNPDIKKLMYNYANDSKLIYKPSTEEKNIFYYKNYPEKWLNDNKMKDYMANGFLELPNKIYSTYYEENIIKFTGEISDSDTVIENANFKIVSFFRNNVIAYDKIKKLYFPIFIESCITGCDKKVEFITNNKIRITHNEYTGNDYNPEDNPNMSVVNLSEIIFKN